MAREAKFGERICTNVVIGDIYQCGSTRKFIEDRQTYHIRILTGKLQIYSDADAKIMESVVSFWRKSLGYTNVTVRKESKVLSILFHDLQFWGLFRGARKLFTFPTTQLNCQNWCDAKVVRTFMMSIRSTFKEIYHSVNILHPSLGVTSFYEVYKRRIRRRINPNTVLGCAARHAVSVVNVNQICESLGTANTNPASSYVY